MRTRRRRRVAAATTTTRTGGVTIAADPAERRRGGVLAVVSGVLTAAVVTAIVTVGTLGFPGGEPEAGASAPTVTSTSQLPATPTPVTPQRNSQGTPQTSLPPAPSADAGGLSAAAGTVRQFVTALNRGDTGAANALLCSAMLGWYGPSSLDGIVPGSLTVGGVMVTGAQGSAVVSYRRTDAADGGRTLYDLQVEHGRWVLCSQH